MANITRSARSGSGWSVNELLAFNIRIDIETVDAATFFGNANLPLPSVSPVILNHVRMSAGPLTKTDWQFFQYLRHASTGEEARVDDFAPFILRLLGYDDSERLIIQRPELPFIMSGERVSTKPDICVTTARDYVPLVQEDTVSKSRTCIVCSH
jgi:hypothetical protein